MNLKEVQNLMIGIYMKPDGYLIDIKNKLYYLPQCGRAYSTPPTVLKYFK